MITEAKVRLNHADNVKNQSKISFQIREVIGRLLRITREVPIMRVKRTTNGPEVRGCKPVTVYFEKWQDKDEILRKATLLKGANIYISEDFSKRVRDQVRLLHTYVPDVTSHPDWFVPETRASKVHENDATTPPIIQVQFAVRQAHHRQWNLHVQWPHRSSRRGEWEYR